MEEIRQDTQKVRDELAELYRALETGELTEEAFDPLEAELLDRLDALEDLSQANAHEDDDVDEESDEEADDSAEAVW